MKMEDHDDDDDDDDDHDEDESTEYRIVKEDSDHSISVCNVKTLNTAIIARSGNCWLQLCRSVTLSFSCSNALNISRNHSRGRHTVPLMCRVQC